MRVLLVASAAIAVGAFSTSTRPTRRSASRQTPLSMAGMGMGTAPVKKKGKKKNGGSKSKGMGAGGKKASDKYDVAKAVLKSEKLYDELMTESIKALNSDEWDESTMDITTEYIISARAKPGSTVARGDGSALVSASDWVPVAQIVVVRPVHTTGHEDDDEMSSSVRAAVSYYRREISYVGTLAAPTLKSLPRNIMQYGAEPIDSFMKYVYEDVIEGKSVESFVEGDGSKVGMTKSKAREVLGLEAGCKDAASIKQAYKTQSMALHPDRFVNSDKTKEEIDEMSARFGLVKMAYEALNSGVREVNGNGESQSWYESLGGKSRTEFCGPIDLMSAEKAGALCNKAFKSAVVGLEPDLTMAFVARNQAAAR